MEGAESNYYLPQVWAEFLSTLPWDWFVSVVPNDVIHPESLDKLFDTFIHRLNRECYGQNYWKDKRKGMLWARATERQRRWAPHHHALIGGVPDYVGWNRYRNFLRNHGADFSRIEPYERDRGAEYYMSKSTYAWKRGEIDLSDSLKHYQDGSWVSAKVLHEEFCRNYTMITKPDLASFRFS